MPKSFITFRDYDSPASLLVTNEHVAQLTRSAQDFVNKGGVFRVVENLRIPPGMAVMYGANGSRVVINLGTDDGE
jgi:hypothetical protein